jgi:hypothetical protein
MKDPKSATIKLLAQAIGDGTIKVHYRHSDTIVQNMTGAVMYVFEVNGIRFRTGWHDSHPRNSLEGKNEYLVVTSEIALVTWYLAQSDTEVIDVEKRRREAQAAIDKAMNALLGPCPF